jgi:hypothetical protein
MSTSDLAQYRAAYLRRMAASPFAPAMMVMNFWFNAWTMFLPRVECQVITFPRKMKAPAP